MLHIHRAERADGLVAALGSVMVEPLDDPMTPEIVSVPTRGIERWLAQQLSTRLGAATGRADGVCANISFPFPGRLVGAAVAAGSGVDGDAWLPERAVWPLLEVVDECLDEPWLGALAAHLGGAGSAPDPRRRARRFATVRHIADLYDHYGVHRPAMLRAWAEAAPAAGGPVTGGGPAATGDPVTGGGPAATGDPVTGGGPAGDDGSGAGWQSELWRRLRHRIGRPSPAERLEEACLRLRADPKLSDLPARVSLFGLTRLPASYLDVLDALAVERDVHLYLLHPSPVLWDRVNQFADGCPPVIRRRDDPTVTVPRNLLLGSWGTDAREMQLVLAAGARASRLIDDHRGLVAPAATLLARIQADVRADRPPPGAPVGPAPDTRARLDPADRSLQVHACHGRARQVEVLRDAILHLLAADPSLEARDIIVMCPDIEAFAPLIQATFGAGDVVDDERDDGVPDAARPPDLRVRLADRSLRQTNPVLGVVSELLELSTARVTASQVLDLAGREPVRRRFRLDDDDLGRVEGWVSDTGVRWGLDGPGRAPYKLQGVEANTWRAGLDRVLLGVAMDEQSQQLFGGVLPLDDVDSGDIDLAGRFAELVDRLHACLDDFGRPKALDAWAASLAAAADALTATSESDSWQRAQLQRVLDDVVGEATGGGAVQGSELTLADVRSVLAQRLQGRPTVANFRTGHLTICTLVPMRSVPHRVVCLLGLDDGVFPRRTARDGDDLTLDDPHVGDRDPRSEDRQLLLDALLAATECLVITYTGRDERTNAVRPPAVPVGELLDVVDGTVTLAPGSDGAVPGAARQGVVAHHPLQPFDTRNFTAGALIPGRPWSFDTVALDGACALTSPRLAPPVFLPAPLPDAGIDPVELDGLVRFVHHPVKAFLRTRLGITVSEWSEDPGDELPIEMDPLEQWGVGDRLLEARLTGADRATSLAAEIARGIVPPGALADPVLDPVGTTVDALLDATMVLVPADVQPASVEVNLRLAGGRSLVGTVPGVSGDLLWAVTYSRLAPKHRLAAWVRLLALTAAYPDRPFTAVTVGRGPGRSVTVARIAVPPDDAVAHLAALVELYDRAMREPLPLYCQTSAAYADAVHAGGDAVAAGRAAWETTFKIEREDKEPEHLLVLGGIHTFEQVLATVSEDDHALLVAPGDDEGSPPRRPAPDRVRDRGDILADPSRFGRLARQLWDGLLSCEERVNR